MASADLRDELLCSICLSSYTDPVMLRCGHNFCRVCIGRVLDIQDGAGVYSCPDCREEFPERPTLMRCLALCNIMESFLFTEPRQEEITGICCTYCVDSPVPAVRSCLHCEASLCDKHLKVHSKSAEHVLSDPSTSLEKRKCSVHKELVRYYCTQDAICICVSCSLAGEHRGHQVEMLDEASEKKKKKLRNVLQKLITKREETEERVRSLEERWRKAQEKASGEAERVTALCTDIRRRVDDLEKRVLSEISRQEKEESLSLSVLIHQLEIKKDELSREMSHIAELCNMTDPLTVLQEPDTGDLCDPEEEGGDEDTWGHDKQPHDGDDLDVAEISDTLHALCEVITGIRSGIYVVRPADILLDVTTAANNLLISDDLKTATRTREKQKRPETAERFQDYPQEKSLEEQRSEVSAMLKTPLRRGDTWYLVACHWFKQWKTYVGFDKSDMDHMGDQNVYPGPIDNSDLLQDTDTQSLKEHLIDELDYVLLPTEGWNKLVSWYSVMENQEPITRKVVEYGLFVKHRKVEVYLIELKLCENGNMSNVVTRRFSRGDTIDMIDKEMRKIFTILDKNETRLWNKYMSNTFELLNNPKSTIQEAGLYQGQVLVIEQRTRGGRWPRDLCRK